MKISDFIGRASKGFSFLLVKVSVALARKKSIDEIVICDVGWRASITGPKFLQELFDFLQRLKMNSPKLYDRVRRNIKYIARADIPHEYIYQSASSILYLGPSGFDFRDPNPRQLDAVPAWNIIEMATKCHLRRGGKELDPGRVESILEWQREICVKRKLI
jgi:hypothetical protein